MLTALLLDLGILSAFRVRESLPLQPWWQPARVRGATRLSSGFLHAVLARGKRPSYR
jgi:hypothetical protein